jgi:hypothetical protein
MSNVSFLKLAVFKTDLYKPASKGKSRQKLVEQLCELFGFNIYYKMPFAAYQNEEIYGEGKVFGETFAVGLASEDIHRQDINVVKFFCEQNDFEWSGFLLLLFEVDGEFPDQYLIEQSLKKRNLL